MSLGALARRAQAAVLVAVLVAIVVVLLPDRAGACSCGYVEEPLEAVGSADVVLVAELQSVTPYHGVDDDFPGSGMRRQGRLRVDAVVVDDPGSSIAPGTVITVQDPLMGCSEGQLELGGGPQVVLLSRDGGRLFVEGCVPAIAVDDVDGIALDLPPPPSAGPVALVTAGSSEGPSDLQLRDIHGAVVAWGALPRGAHEASICPGGEVVIADLWGAGEPDQLVTVDVTTMERRTLRTGALPEGGGDVVCAASDASRLVRTHHATDDEPRRFAVIDAATGATISETTSPNGGGVSVTADGELVVTSDAALELLDAKTGRLSPIAVVPEDAVPIETVALVDGGVAVLLASPEAVTAGAPPYAAMLRTDPGLTTASAIDIVEPNLHGDVTALPDGSLLVVDHDLHATLLAPDGTVRGRFVPDDQQRSAASSARAANQPVWLGLSGGEITWSEPGDTSVDLVVPVGTAARFVPERPVDPALQGVRTRDALRARVLPDGWPAAQATTAPAASVAAADGLAALAAIAAAMGGLGIALGVRRRAGAMELDRRGER